VFKPGKRHKSAGPGAAGRAALLACLLVPWAVSTGCSGFWDEFRANDYSIKAVFHPPEPLSVLANSNATGDQRARALARLREPLQNKGTQRDQDYVLTLLTSAAKDDQQAYCRLAAMNSLSTFKDVRASQALVNAYYAAEKFPAETRSVLHIRAIQALGNFADRDQNAVDLLVRVVQAPPVEAGKSSEDEKQMYLDERVAAAHSLEHSHNYRATEALVGVLRNEKDVALRDRAHESLVAITGKKLPSDAKAWEDLLNNPDPPKDRSIAGGEKTRIMPPILRTGATDQPK
jgi:hypothetical protein